MGTRKIVFFIKKVFFPSEDKMVGLFSLNKELKEEGPNFLNSTVEVVFSTMREYPLSEAKETDQKKIITEELAQTLIEASVDEDRFIEKINELIDA